VGKTGISWTDDTWNPTKGCSRVSEGCRHCYAEVQAARIVRMGKGKPTVYDGLVSVRSEVSGLRYEDVHAAGSYVEPRWTGKVALDAKALALPLSWRAPRRIFVNSMSDLFHESLTNEQIAAVFGVMAAAPQHTFQVLTKRARRMREWFEWLAAEQSRVAETPSSPSLNVVVAAYEALNRDLRVTDPNVWPLPNVWLGVSVENQEAADERIPELLRTPAAVRFLSCEPLLGPVDLAAASPNARSLVEDLDWIIAGCESGPGARPCSVEWLRSLRDQSAAAGVAFFLKQATHEPAFDAVTARADSKRKPGGVIELPYLDGVQHASFPEVP
jgi:protein gp37